MLRDATDVKQTSVKMCAGVVRSRNLTPRDILMSLAVDTVAQNVQNTAMNLQICN
jgi:hypothetical protein